MIFYTIIFLVIALAVAYFLGSKRQIGFGWSFFFSFFLSPLGGFIATMLSPKYYNPNPEPSTTKKVIGWILVAYSVLTGILMLKKVGSGHYSVMDLNSLFMDIGFTGLGIYLIMRADGTSFNSDELTKTDD